MTLSVEDRLEIREQIARYNATEDVGQIGDWVNTFTVDGSFTARTGRSWQGHDVLMRFGNDRWQRPGVRQYVHWVNNIMITPTSEGAQSRCYVMLVQQLADGYCIKGLAAKTDKLRRERSRWRFLNRRSAPWPVWDVQPVAQEDFPTAQATTGTLSVADRLEIEDLFARYNYAEDTGQVEPWVSTFASDGSFTDRSGRSQVGAVALTRFARKRGERPDLGRYLHWTNNAIVTPTDHGAQAMSHIMMVEKTAGGCVVRGMSAKADQLRREQGRWRFQSRQILAWPTWSQDSHGEDRDGHNASRSDETVNGTLSADDQLQIEELIARSFLALDLGEIEAWVNLFTTSGGLTNPAGKSWVGADEMTRFAHQRWDRPGARQRLHTFDNLIIAPNENGARARYYCMQIEQTSSGCKVYSMSAINDEVRREQGRWRIHARRVARWPVADCPA